MKFVLYVSMHRLVDWISDMTYFQDGGHDIILQKAQGS